MNVIVTILIIIVLGLGVATAVYGRHLQNYTLQLPINLPEWRFQTTIMLDGTELTYAVLLPANYIAGEAYPLLLALPPGGQDRVMVNLGMRHYWQLAAKRYGMIVVSPIAPPEQLFFRDGEAILPDFVTYLQRQFHIKGKVHLAGMSNGGISAFHTAVLAPDLFQTLTVMAGYPQKQDALHKLNDLPIQLFVGENDTPWRGLMEQTLAILQTNGHPQVSLEVIPDNDHELTDLQGEGMTAVFDQITNAKFNYPITNYQ